MDQAATFETITDWIVVLSMGVVLSVLYIGWLASYRTPKASPSSMNLWFRLPAWGQIAAGLAISGLGAYCGYVLWVPIPVTLPSDVMTVLRAGGLMILFGGALLFLWSRRTLGGMYNASTSSAVQLHADHRLIQHGPYALVRHPIYLSYWLMLTGLLAIYHTWMALLTLVLLALSLSRRAQAEERVLNVTFGEAWRKYAARVSMFVPRREKMKPL